MQTFYLAGNTTAHYATLNQVIAAGKNVGLFASPTLDVDGSSILVGAHGGLFPTNFYLYEEATASLVAPAFSQVSSTWTIGWVLDPDGFSNPTLTTVSGAYTQQDALMTNYLVLGWIFYPGGSVDLSNNMLIPCPIACTETVLADYPGERFKERFDSANASAETIDHTVTATLDDYGTCTIANTSAASAAYSVDMSVTTGPIGANSMRLDIGLSSQASVSFYKRYDDGTVQSVSIISEGSMLGKLDRDQYQVPLIRYSPAAWETWVLRMNIVLGAGASLTLARLCVTTGVVTTLTKY